jgi:hypothetical protein
LKPRSLAYLLAVTLVVAYFVVSAQSAVSGVRGLAERIHARQTMTQ